MTLENIVDVYVFNKIDKTPLSKEKTNQKLYLVTDKNEILEGFSNIEILKDIIPLFLPRPNLTNTKLRLRYERSDEFKNYSDYKDLEDDEEKIIKGYFRFDDKIIT